jgi:CheY-like chemotaxis protein
MQMAFNDRVSILIIDDDPDDREMMTSLIQEEASLYDISFAETGDKATVYLSSLNTEQLPKLIIIDYYMPVITGLDLLRSIKATEQLRHIPLVIYTNSFYPLYKGKCMAAGASLYLPKSSSFEGCREDIKKILSYCLID